MQPCRYFIRSLTAQLVSTLSSCPMCPCHRQHPLVENTHIAISAVDQGSQLCTCEYVFVSVYQQKYSSSLTTANPCCSVCSRGCHNCALRDGGAQAGLITYRVRKGAATKCMWLHEDAMLAIPNQTAGRPAGHGSTMHRCWTPSNAPVNQTKEHLICDEELSTAGALAHQSEPLHPRRHLQTANSMASECKVCCRLQTPPWPEEDLHGQRKNCNSVKIPACPPPGAIACCVSHKPSD